MIVAPEPQSYMDLRIDLSDTDDKGGVVRFDSPAGEEKARLRLYLSPQEVEMALASAARTGGAYLKRSGAVDSLDPVRELGAQLFEALFEGRRQGLYRRSLQIAEDRGMGLRLRVIAEDEAMAALPWEFLYDGRDFVNLSAWSPVVRTHPLTQPSESLESLSRLHLCIMTADVTGGTMEAEREIEVLQKLAEETSQLEIDVVHDVTFPRIREVLAGDGFDVLHFIGTGSASPDDNQMLALLDPDQDPAQQTQGVRPYRLVRTAFLAEALRGERRLRWIVLSACDTDRIAGELALRLTGSNRAVLGIRGKITVDSCIAFSGGLYRGILGSLPLEAAVTQGRQAIDGYSPGSREWGLPVLHMKYAETLLLSRPSAPPQEEAIPKGSLEFAVPQPPPDAGTRREWQKLHMLLEIRERNLQALEEQQASFQGTVPAAVVAQIDETRSEIADLRERLDSLQPTTR